MLDAADLPDDIAALKTMLLAAQAREVRKDERIERLEKLVVNQHRTLTPFAYPILTPLCCRSALGLPSAGRGCRG
ncbi:hypothetical protein LZK78_32265 (plasmid) [Rhizobium leguminosarum]|nr:hypothetical protein [Rhizobium leguminosarum]UIJ83156.1 hypothetical protein LZK78_32265 [Rhizobium leguminosarum]